MGRWGLNPLESDAGLDERGYFDNFIYKLYEEDYKKKNFKIFTYKKKEFEDLSLRQIRKIVTKYQKHIVRYLSTSKEVEHVAGFILFDYFQYFKYVNFSKGSIEKIMSNTIYDLEFFEDYQSHPHDNKPYDYLYKNKDVLVGTYNERLHKINIQFKINYKEMDVIVPRCLFDTF